MAVISELLDRELNVKRDASKTDAGIVWETIIGIMKKKYEMIWYSKALLLRNILIRSKNSTIRKSDVNIARMKTNNLTNSLVI
jgi:hypothetical protein